MLYAVLLFYFYMRSQHSTWMMIDIHCSLISTFLVCVLSIVWWKYSNVIEDCSTCIVVFQNFKSLILTENNNNYYYIVEEFILVPWILKKTCKPLSTMADKINRCIIYSYICFYTLRKFKCEENCRNYA